MSLREGKDTVKKKRPIAEEIKALLAEAGLNPVNSSTLIPGCSFSGFVSGKI